MSIFLFGIKAGTCLVREITMAEDCGAGELGLELVQEGEECVLLRLRPCVLRGLAVLGEPADVADADGMGVAVLAVCADFGEWSALVDAAVTVDDVVIADALEATGTVPAVDVGDGEIFAFGSG